MDWYGLTRTVTDKFLEHEFRRMKKWTDNLIEQNDNIRANRGEKKVKCFVFDGFSYFHTDHTPYSDVPGSEFEIDAEIKSFVEADLNLKDDKRKIRQIATLLLLPCDSYQQARDALPDELVETHPDLACLSRENSIDYSIFEERTQKHLDELRDLISFYSATRLIY